ncbi:MAG TPA: AMP-binding protein [Streptosporangiaceae bacterium]|nr:AMP-binding protein [Streptosporangiaceae bacterium]
MSKLDDLIADVSVTKRLVAVATDRAGLIALIGGPGPDGQPGSGCYSYANFAATVQAAAAGLSWRGLRPRDVVGLLVPDAVSFALAAHAVRAAGGVPSPVDPELCPVETAGQLAESGARMVITAPPLADSALAAVDRSWVRQVFSFIDAPGATRFADLLGLDMIRPPRGRPDDVALLPFSRGPDGRLRPVPVTHAELVERVDRADQQAGITGHDVVLVLPPFGDGLSYAASLDGALLRGATVVAAAEPSLAMAAGAHHGTVAIVPRLGGVAVPDSLRAVPIG